MEWEKRGLRQTEVHVEVYDVRESWDPTTPFCVCGRDYPGAPHRQICGVTRRRNGGIRKRVFPCLQVTDGAEPDVGEEVVSSTMDPRFGDEAATLQRVSCVV